MLRGVYTAIITPFNQDGSVDFKAFRKLVEYNIKGGVAGIVVCGTTGESPTLSHKEKEKLVKVAIKKAKKRVAIIAGTGSNNTSESIGASKKAQELGADAVMLVNPYYNKPTQEGLYRHFRAIAEAVAIPHIVYNVPGRTVADLQTDTTLRLAQIPNIVGIKDATANLERGADLLRRKPGDFLVFSGDDATGLALMLLGGHGVISVTANAAPRMMHEMCAAALAGDVARARDINNKLLGLHRHLFCEANPIPVKWVVQQIGLIKGGIRLPLTPLSAGCHDLVRTAMRQAEIAT